MIVVDTKHALEIELPWPAVLKLPDRQVAVQHVTFADGFDEAVVIGDTLYTTLEAWTASGLPMIPVTDLRLVEGRLMYVGLLFDEHGNPGLEKTQQVFETLVRYLLREAPVQPAG